MAKRREKIAKEMWEKIEENLDDPQEREKHREMFDLDE